MLSIGMSSLLLFALVVLEPLILTRTNSEGLPLSVFRYSLAVVFRYSLAVLGKLVASKSGRN